MKVRLLLVKYLPFCQCKARRRTTAHSIVPPLSLSLSSSLPSLIKGTRTALSTTQVLSNFHSRACLLNYFFGLHQIRKGLQANKSYRSRWAKGRRLIWRARDSKRIRERVGWLFMLSECGISGTLGRKKHHQLSAVGFPFSPRPWQTKSPGWFLCHLL